MNSILSSNTERSLTGSLICTCLSRDILDLFTVSHLAIQMVHSGFLIAYALNNVHVEMIC